MTLGSFGRIIMNVNIKLAAIGVLKKRLGMKKLLTLLPRMDKRKKQGEPWHNLFSPETIKDQESRVLIGDAVLLYREILEKMPKDPNTNKTKARWDIQYL